MAPIDQALLARLERELGVSRRQVYRLIEAKARVTLLDRDLAAILVAADHSINISKYSTPEQRDAIRGSLASRPATPPLSPSPVIKKVARPIEPIGLNLSAISNKELEPILTRDLAELNFARSQGLDKTPKTA